MIRIGLLGASRIAPVAVIAPAAKRRDVAVTAVAARDIARAKDYARSHNIPSVFDSYEELATSDSIDIVYCALPPSEHLDICLQALAAGKALLIEKPYAIDAAAAERIAIAANDAGRPAIEAFHYRFHAQFETALELVRNGRLGQIERASGRFCVRIPRVTGELRWIAACGGGATMDLGCYVIHALRTLLGHEPLVKRVRADIVDGVDVTLRADLQFHTIRASVEWSMTEDWVNEIEIAGSDATLLLTNFVAPHEGGRLVLKRRTGTYEETAIGPSTYEAQLAHLVDVYRGEAAPLTGGADAIANMRAVDRCRTAAGL